MKKEGVRKTKTSQCGNAPGHPQRKTEQTPLQLQRKLQVFMDVRISWSLNQWPPEVPIFVSVPLVYHLLHLFQLLKAICFHYFISLTPQPSLFICQSPPFFLLSVSLFQSHTQTLSLPFQTQRIKTKIETFAHSVIHKIHKHVCNLHTVTQTLNIKCKVDYWLLFFYFLPSFQFTQGFSQTQTGFPNPFFFYRIIRQGHTSDRFGLFFSPSILYS